MSFRTSCPVASRSFELVQRSLLQAPSLPFTEALTAEHIERAFAAEGISFGEGDGCGHEPIYTPAITLWAMLSQALFTREQRSCSAAVSRVATHLGLSGEAGCSTNTGAYCRARNKVTEGVVQRLTEELGERCEAEVPDEWRWLGRTVRVVDGTTLSMPDTPQNQAEYPQPSSQTEGVGFPLMRVLALVSLATGLVMGMAEGPYAGKETGETALLRTLFDQLQPGNVVLADRYHCGWFMLALLREMGLDFVMRLHQLRSTDFRRGRRLGRGDHVVIWAKPAKPEWLDQEAYDRLPEQLEIREVLVHVAVPGCRTESLVVVTSLLAAEEVSAAALAALYRQRWNVELNFRDIKSRMQLDVLRRKTPARVRQELWTGLLAYNLVRQSMLQSAQQVGRLPCTLSFTVTLQTLANNWVSASPSSMPAAIRTQLISLRIVNGGKQLVGNRPDRVEPRAIKRRPPPHDWLMVPRQQARQTLLTGPPGK